MSEVGFACSRAGAARVWLRDDVADALREAGLGEPATWERWLAGAPRGASGRGAVARVALPGLRLGIVVKRLERGGLLARLWRGRFFGIGRLLANLTTPEQAVGRGVATPRALALVAIPGPPGFWRGRLAVEEIPGAEDLRLRLRRGPLSAPETEAVARVLHAMHDAGLEHRDLNLGNLLLRGGGGSPEAYVLDLDGARWNAGPLSFAKRQRALRRLERSCRRVLGRGPGDGAAGAFYAAYAAGDPILGARIASGRAWGRLWLALRSLGRGSAAGKAR